MQQQEGWPGIATKQQVALSTVCMHRRILLGTELGAIQDLLASASHGYISVCMAEQLQQHPPVISCAEKLRNATLPSGFTVQDHCPWK